TRVGRAGTPACTSAGPMDGATGRPSVVDAMLTSSCDMFPPCAMGPVVFKEQRRRGSITGCVAGYVLEQSGELLLLILREPGDCLDEFFLCRLRRAAD